MMDLGQWGQEILLDNMSFYTHTLSTVNRMTQKGYLSTSRDRQVLMEDLILNNNRYVLSSSHLLFSILSTLTSP